MVLKNGKTVTFVFRPDGSCHEVALAGSFNSWEPSKGKMSRQKDGSYRKRLTLSPGEYRYKFLIDKDKWIEDPQAEKQAPNEFGSQDSVVVV
jgi:cyclomaltodextrinase / maltogenic alpha-amylase / neopullulanase